MPARKTESRIPLDLQPSDLGHAVVATDGRCALVSFVTSPLVIQRENIYVVFITDASLASDATSFEWTFTENLGAPKVESSEFGEITYITKNLGPLDISVRILDVAKAELAQLSIVQQVVPISADLETLISNAIDQPGPSIGSPEVLRELINQHNLYYQNVAPVTPESGDGFKRFVFSMVYDGASQRNAAERKRHLDQLALSLNTATIDFATQSSKVAGICGIRPLLLAMTVPGMLEWTFLPENANQRSLALEQLQQSLAALEENKRIDLYNILRFPKSNITYCSRILETLRNKYFSSTNFDDVLTGMSGVRAQWIKGQYLQGPIERNP